MFSMDFILNKILARDKLLHILVGLLIGYSCTLYLGIYSLLIVTIIAGGKELYDKTCPERHTAEWLDFWVTIAGGISGYFMVIFARF